MIKDRILIIEDEKPILRFLSRTLEQNGYSVMEAEDGQKGLSMVESYVPDLIILDLGLPDIDGVDVLKKIRTWTYIPVVVVSARTMEQDKVQALDLGADDYLTKPFGTSELLARIRTALRHVRTAADSEEVAEKGTYTVRDLVVDMNRHRVTVAGKDVGLTQMEYKIVELLAKNPGKVLTYDYLMKELWGPHAGHNNQILRVNMANIRRKIEKHPAEPEYLFTEVGVGYRLAQEEAKPKPEKS